MFHCIFYLLYFCFIILVVLYEKPAVLEQESRKLKTMYSSI